MRLALFLLAAGWPSPALAATALATGSAPDIPWMRLILAVLAGLLLAGGACGLLRKRSGKVQPARGMARLFGRLASSSGGSGALHRRLRIVETRRASQFADLCLVEAEGRAYLLALSAGGATLIDCPPLPSPTAPEAGPAAPVAAATNAEPLLGHRP